VAVEAFGISLEFRDFSLISTVPGQLAWQKRMIERLGSGNTQSFFLLPPPPPQAEVEEEEREWATSRYSPLIAFTSRTSRRGSVGISEKSRNFSCKTGVVEFIA